MRNSSPPPCALSSVTFEVLDEAYSRRSIPGKDQESLGLMSRKKKKKKRWERVSLNSNGNICDDALGGQKQFRFSFLKSPFQNQDWKKNLAKVLCDTVLGMKEKRFAVSCQEVFPCIYIHYLE